MIPGEEVMQIVSCTNKRITELHAIIGERFREMDQRTHYKLTSLTEMKDWFGLLYFCAALKLNKTDTEIVWCHESSNDIFSATMQRKKLIFLARVVPFNDAETCKEWWNHDKFEAAFRKFFEAANHNFLKLQKPSPRMVIVETLYSFCGRISFQQYNLSRHVKYSSLSKVCVIQWYNSHMYCFHLLGSHTCAGQVLHNQHWQVYWILLLRGLNISLDCPFNSMTKEHVWNGIWRRTSKSPKSWSSIGREYQRKWKKLLQRMVLYMNRNQQNGATMWKGRDFLYRWGEDRNKDCVDSDNNVRRDACIKRPQEDHWASALLWSHEGRGWWDGSCVNLCFDQAQNEVINTEFQLLLTRYSENQWRNPL